MPFAAFPNPIPAGLPYLDSKLMDIEWKRWIGNELASGRKGPAYFIKKYKLKKGVLSKWKKLVESGSLVFGINGRPPAIDSPEAKKRIVLPPGKYKLESCKTNDLLREAAAETAQKRAKSGKAAKKISPSTIYRYRKKYKINSGNAEVTTAARAKAMADIRNFLSYAAMAAVIGLVCDPGLKFNMDATTFTVGRDLNEMVKVDFIKTEKKYSIEGIAKQ